MRHGEAEASFSNDKQRQLTERGRTQVAHSAQLISAHLTQTSNIDLALVSPYRRTQQTYDVLSQSLPFNQKLNSELFTPMSSVTEAADLIGGYVAQNDPLQHLLIVSHMPLVSFLTAELTSIDTPPIFSTSAFAVIDIQRSNLQGQLIALIQQHD